MREIKFRAWHKSRCEMLPIIDIEYLMTKGALVTDYKDFVENIYPNIMQYTGLKDKNGVEIYEGDIVMAPYMNKKPCIVKYSSVLAKFTMSDKFNFTAIDANLEVIGNIYENKELLG